MPVHQEENTATVLIHQEEKSATNQTIFLVIQLSFADNYCCFTTLILALEAVPTLKDVSEVDAEQYADGLRRKLQCSFPGRQIILDSHDEFYP